MHLYALRDSAARTFGSVFCAKSETLAIRDLKILVNKDNNAIAASPSDYELYSLGDYDENTGRIEAADPVLVIRCVDLVGR